MFWVEVSQDDSSDQDKNHKVKWKSLSTLLYLTKWNCHGVQFFSMGFSDTSLCKICPNDHPGKVSSIVRVTLIGSELLFFDSIDVKLAQCVKMKIKVEYFFVSTKGHLFCKQCLHNLQFMKTRSLCRTVYKMNGL